VDWNIISQVSRFEPLNEVFTRIGQPKFKLGDRSIYYLGEGFFISYTDRMFRIENFDRVEYGESDEYALNAYFFRDIIECIGFFNLTKEQICFYDDFNKNSFEITDGVRVGDTLSGVKSTLRPRAEEGRYSEGEDRKLDRLSNSFIFRKNWITWRNYEFYFYGESNKTPLASFEYHYR
jgi:hypothetical protein